MTQTIRLFMPGPSSRFFPQLRDYLCRRDIFVQPRGRKLLVKQPGLEFFLARGFDIPHAIELGLGDLGVTGVDAVLEKGAKVRILKRIGIRCSDVVIASRTLRSLEELSPGDLIVSEYPALTRFFLEQRNLRGIEVKYVSGAAEAYAHHDRIAAVVTLRTTGRSVVDNELNTLAMLLSTEACLIAPERTPVEDDVPLQEILNRLPYEGPQDEPRTAQ